ncbi:RnfABCDGE type electron transport complex subunit G [bacterium]|nr:RnfABCDGE type electron transport complex subunit G [bacterium]NIN91603.1 RnfABCDGE type electron transport complex subunit G [bacterium]NIO17967.1 RnfABCDGE type electron transport complex subunit G [bacterium]NIO73735.1 RnfABCDGE type electron transport complex subunit G [bacterium]
MKRIMMRGLLLMAMASLAAWALSLTYKNTKPRIDAYAEQEARKARKEVISAASKFVPINIEEQEYFIGYDERGKGVGVSIRTKTQGYSGPIEMIMGFDMNGEITGLKILNQIETPGLGSKIMEDWFSKQFIKLKAEDLNFAKEEPQGKIEAVTAATISSRAVLEGAKKLFGLYVDFLEHLEKIEILKYMPDGVYTGEGRGFSGPIRAMVTVQNHQILKIAVLEQQEVIEYWSKIREKIPQEILEKQNVDVDMVSGATYSSKGLIEAVTNALEKGIER